MISKRISIPISEKESVSLMLSVPDSFTSAAAVIVAHGAGNDMDNPLIVSFCERLTKAGFLSVRFNFPYKEYGREAPDRREILEITWQRVYDFVNHESDYLLRNIFIAGKSMGGRIASQMLAAGRLPCNGIIFLGYPLHPAGEKEKLRVEHLYQIKIHMLFLPAIEIVSAT